MLAAVKEMNVKKGASIFAIFKYISAVYRYDVQRNRRLLKRTLEKLIAEQVVEQVKGHGLAGSFKLGKNYKEQKRREKTKEQVQLASVAISKNVVKTDLSTACIPLACVCRFCDASLFVKTKAAPFALNFAKKLRL